MTAQELRDEGGLAAMGLVRAYSVPSLDDAQIRFRSEDEMPQALTELLRAQLPGYDWAIPTSGRARWTQSFRSLGLINGAVPAPVDERTGDPMGLEILAFVVEGPPMTAAPEWVMQIQRGLYASMTHLGATIPFYLP